MTKDEINAKLEAAQQELKTLQAGEAPEPGSLESQSSRQAELEHEIAALKILLDEG